MHLFEQLPRDRVFWGYWNGKTFAITYRVPPCPVRQIAKASTVADASRIVAGALGIELEE